MEEPRYRLRALASEGHSRDLAIKDQLAIDHPLAVRDESASIELHETRQEVQGVARDHLTSKTHFIASGEAKEPLHSPAPGIQKTGQLRRGFDHEHSRKERSARNVPLDPEFVMPDQFVANANGEFGIVPQHAVALAHVPHLRKAVIKGVAAKENPSGVNGSKVNDEFGSHGRLRGVGKGVPGQ